MTERAARMLRVSCLLVASVVANTNIAHAQDTWSSPFAGVRRLHRVTPSQNINLLVIDLCAAGISARATQPNEGHQTVPSYAMAIGAQIAVNANFYNPANWRQLDGVAMGNAMRWPSSDHNYTGPVGFGQGRVSIVPHEVVAEPEPWMREVVSGHPTVVEAGRTPDNSGDWALCPRNPRTAVGLSRDHRTLFIAVVDGRAPGRAGMTCNELGQFMLSVGAFDAVNLDGGGSSVLWMQGAGVVNRPSDGALRLAANHLAIYARGAGAAAHCPDAAPVCTRRCEGSTLVSPDCSRGDCAAFGATCIDDAMGPRCRFAFCPAIGDAEVCFSGTHAGHCHNGALTMQTDCSTNGGRCAVMAGAGRCVGGVCPAAGNARVCVSDTQIGDCANGRLTGMGDCGAFGARCVDDELGARCVFIFCPARGEVDVCWASTHQGHCRDGALVTQGDCGAFAAFCSNAPGTQGRCVSAFCALDENTPPVARSSCWLEPNKIAHCDAMGGFRIEDCPAGQQCSQVGTTRCLPAVCPAMGSASVCLDAQTLGRCSAGSVLDGEDCGRRGGRCVVTGTQASCEYPDDAGALDVREQDATGDAMQASWDGGANRDAGDLRMTAVPGCACRVPSRFGLRSGPLRYMLVSVGVLLLVRRKRKRRPSKINA
jgi:hypothetical protein